MRTWVFRASAARPGEQSRTFNVLAKGGDQEKAIALAMAEMTTRGWEDVEILRCAELTVTTRDVEGYLQNAVANVEKFGFSFIRYGAADH